MAAKRKAPAEQPAGAVRAAKKRPSQTSKPRVTAAHAAAAEEEPASLAQPNGDPHKSKSQLKAARKALAAARGKARHARTASDLPDALKPAAAGSAAPDAANVKGAKSDRPAVKAGGSSKGRRRSAAGAAASTADGDAPDGIAADGVMAAEGETVAKPGKRRRAAAAPVHVDAEATSSDSDASDDSTAAEEANGAGAAAALDAAAGAAANGARQPAGRETAAHVPDSGGFRNREKVLILSSRGIPHRREPAWEPRSSDTTPSAATCMQPVHYWLGLVLCRSQPLWQVIWGSWFVPRSVLA